jgi:2-iminobutanoate/2-iminopropanoate deaminase
MSKQIYFTEEAPRPIGPYSQAIGAGDFVFVSGQLGFEPTSGNLVAGGVQAEARQALRNLFAIVAAAGLKPEQIVRVELFLSKMADFAAVNQVYCEFFADDAKPARQAIESPNLPKGASFEVSCVAYRG